MTKREPKLVKRLSIRLDENLYAELEKLSQELHINKSIVLRLALLAYLEKMRKNRS